MIVHGLIHTSYNWTQSLWYKYSAQQTPSNITQHSLQQHSEHYSMAYNNTLSTAPWHYEHYTMDYNNTLSIAPWLTIALSITPHSLQQHSEQYAMAYNSTLSITPWLTLALWALHRTAHNNTLNITQCMAQNRTKLLHTTFASGLQTKMYRSKYPVQSCMTVFPYVWTV